MSHLQLDGETLARLLAQAGVSGVQVDGGGAALTASGWQAHVEKLQLEATVRVAGIALRVTGVQFGADGVGVRFSVE